MELALATLDEVPREVCNYFKRKNRAPGKARLKRLETGKSRLETGGSLIDRDQAQSTPADGRATAEAEEEETPFELPKFLVLERQKLIRDAVATGKIKESDCEAVLELGISCPDAALLTELWEQLKGEKQSASRADSHRPVSLAEHGTVRQGAMGAWGTQQGHPAVNIPGTVTKDDLVEKVTPAPRAKTHDQIPTVASEDDPRLRVNTLDGAEMIGSGAQRKKEKKKEYDDDGICKICLENPIDTVIVECGHQVICESCSPLVGAMCPLCRQPIVKVIKTYNT
jgi:hypothetical protein